MSNWLVPVNPAETGEPLRPKLRNDFASFELSRPMSMTYVCVSGAITLLHWPVFPDVIPLKVHPRRTPSTAARYVEAARVLAGRMMPQYGATPAERICFPFLLPQVRSRCWGSFLPGQATYTARTDAALKLLANGEAKRNEQFDFAELSLGQR